MITGHYLSVILNKNVPKDVTKLFRKEFKLYGGGGGDRRKNRKRSNLPRRCSICGRKY